MNKRSASLFVGASLLTTLLSGTFLFLAPIPARHLHKNHGRLAYWLFAVLSTALILYFAPQWAVSHATVLVLMGVYSELERHDVSQFYSGLGAVLLTLVFIGFTVLLWGKVTGVPMLAVIKGHVTEIVGQYKKVRGVNDPEISVAMVLSLLPAVFSGVLMLLVFVGAVFARPMRSLKPLQFKVPIYFIWVLIASLAGTFLLDPVKQFYAQKVFSNVLFISAAAYYFQGLSVMGFYFRKLSINYFLRTVLFFAIGVHLFIFVACLGLSDLWFDYRSKGYKTRVNSK